MLRIFFLKFPKFSPYMNNVWGRIQLLASLALGNKHAKPLRCKNVCNSR